jgi:prepilin-type N-terminal cleavage/methylation domain-containing protein
MRRHPAAFSLIEMLAALALGTLLMLAAMGVLRSLAHFPAATITAQSPQTEVVRLLRWDLANARRFESTPDGVILWGLDSLDPVDMTATHRPAKVIYRIADFAGVSSLMRLEEPLGAAMGRENPPQLICSNVSRIAIRGISDSANATGDAQPFERNQGRPLPQCVEVSLTSSLGVEMQTILCLR